MKNKITLLLCLLTLQLSAQKSIWTAAVPADASAIAPRTSTPKIFTIFQTDLPALKNSLAQAALHGTNNGVNISLPDGNGQFTDYKIWRSEVLHPTLAAKYPGIKTYIGQSVLNPAQTAAISLTLYGLHAMIMIPGEGVTYIDPYTKGGDYSIAYFKKGITTSRSFECHTQPFETANTTSTQRNVLDNGIMRTYRFAMACTVEYSAFHIAEAGLQSGTLAQQKEAVLAAMTATITRLNTMYGRDLSVFFQLIPNNDQLIFIGDDDFDNEDVGSMIGQGTIYMNDIIGLDNYDIGHTVGTSGGGLAGGSPCTNDKAIGATGTGAPVGDPFDIDYVAHEVGHQFGAGHTFNNSCGGNVDTNVSYEPGSGSTIMAYAGICDPNVQFNSDAQFHAASIMQIRDRINGLANCAATTITGNTPPIANAGPDFIVPKGTPLKLSGSATDAQNDALTYSWEQYDKQITTQPPTTTAAQGPNFRSQLISASPIRYLPSLQSLSINDQVPTWEVIPDTARTMHFALTVRDNNINGGESATDFMTVTVSGTAGPFAVTSPNSGLTLAGGSNKLITWNVAGTTANNINAATVDILFSSDAGLHFDTMLAENVPNDGNEIITIPNLPGTANRIMVRAHDNIFFDISDQNFTITPPGNTFSVAVAGSHNVSVCKGNNAVYAFQYEALNNFTDNTTFSVAGLPAGITAIFNPANVTATGTVQLTLGNTANAAAGFYNLTISAQSGAITRTANVYLNLLNPDFSTVTTLFPANNEYGVSYAFDLKWVTGTNASAYDILLDDNADFSSPFLTTSSTSTSVTVSGLSPLTTYYWKVKPKNEGCEGTFGPVAAFTTGTTICDTFESTDVPLEIAEDLVGTVVSTLTLEDDFPVDSATLALELNHTWLTDLSVTLISPSGTQIKLFSHQCGDQDDVSATFSDAGQALTCGSGTPAISGTFRPEVPFSNLHGESAAGTWTLSVYDEYAQDGGAVTAWSLNLCKIATPLSVTDQNLADFTLFPNPNNGSFSIRPLSPVSKGSITVYDMRGRTIYNKPTMGTPTESISLQAAPGIYMMELRSENGRGVRKFIIQ